MNNAFDSLFIFGFLTFFHLWGGAALGAGVAGRRWLPAVCGLVIGAAPLALGVERIATLGSLLALSWQLACLLLSALWVGLRAARLRALLLSKGMSSIMAGVLVMVVGMVAAALLVRTGAEALSLLVGGAVFIYGAMWVGSGIRTLCSN